MDNLEDFIKRSNLRQRDYNEKMRRSSHLPKQKWSDIVYDRSSRKGFEGPSSSLFDSWKSSVDDNLIQTAGYSLEYAATILGPGPRGSMSRVMKLRFDNEWSAEDVAAEIANEVENASL